MIHRPTLQHEVFFLLGNLSLTLIRDLHRNTYCCFSFVLSPLGDTVQDLLLSFPHHLQYKLESPQSPLIAWTISDLLLASRVSLVAICYFQLLSQLSDQLCVKMEPLSFDPRNTDFSRAKQRRVHCMGYEEVAESKKPESV